MCVPGGARMLSPAQTPSRAARPTSIAPSMPTTTPAPLRRSRFARRATTRAVALCGAALALAATPRGAAAQPVAPSVTATCAATDATGCTALRFLLASGDAPWAITAFSAQLGAGWTFLGGATTTFTGEDDFAFGVPFTGTAAVTSGHTVFADLLASPGFSFELGPASRGWLQFAVAGAGAMAPVSVSIVDPDGGTVGGTVPVITADPTVAPEPATLALLGGGLLALGAAARLRRAA